MSFKRSKRPSDFDQISLGNEGLTVLFGNSSLKEARGVGRVARLLHQQFKSMATEGETTEVVTFCPFFMDSPSYPLKNTVVTIHDFTVMEMPEFQIKNQRFIEDFKQICSIASHFVACAPSVREKLHTRYGVPAEKISYIPNPIVENPEMTEVEGLPEGPYLLHACAPNPSKNLEILFKAWAILGKDAPQLLVTNRAYETHPLLDGLGIRDKVTFIGRQDQAKIQYLMHKADGLLLPSRSEGFSMVVLEATSVETPSIIATGNGLQDVIDTNEAFFCDPDDPSQWAETIRKLVADGDDGRVRRLRERLLRQQNLALTAERYLQVFKSLTQSQ